MPDKTSPPHATDLGGTISDDGAAADGDDRRYYKKDFWSRENPKYRQPHFRLRKAARVVNELAQGRERTLLDIGCGPAALMHLVTPNIRYHGIDISIPDPAPNLMEADILKGPISFEGKRFDIVVAQGLFEYLGGYQDEKLSDIARLLEKDGTLVISYVNFGHRRPELYWPYNNIQPIDEFRRSLLHYFRVDACFPTSHNWRHSEPNRSFIAAINMRFNVTIPFVTPKLAVEFFFLCSPLDPKVSPIRN